MIESIFILGYLNLHNQLDICHRIQTENKLLFQPKIISKIKAQSIHYRGNLLFPVRFKIILYNFITLTSNNQWIGHQTIIHDKTSVRMRGIDKICLSLFPIPAHFPLFDIKFYGEVNLIHYKLTDENVDRAIYSLVSRMFFLGVFLFVNMSLLTATSTRNLKSIVIWLLAHTTHMFYTLSFNIWVGVYTNTMSIILISIFNTMLYFMFIFMVMLFWLSERYSGRRHYRVAINMV
ncbi:Uncharacterized protein FWK35_00015258 [Aphis craccivora]|uniref:Uncharacterized protein n=1 Tax=Aphis craccivora TaxID=307492 RepID=A0A6G0YNZ4_APHCR|nr:Uncharacterized protein FWK35_00015258 [Aphis craccivora]